MNETNQGTTPSDRSSGLSPRALRGLFVAVVVLALVALSWPRGQLGSVPGGSLFDAEGRPTLLATQLAPVTLVHFWATWCPPCLGEIPVLYRLSDDFETNPDFRVLFVAVDDTVAHVERLVGENRASRVLYDPEGAISRELGARTLPASHLVVDGDIVETFVGPENWDDPTVRSRLRGEIERRR
jgi:thiol-disulfide isomerase/thioredoxin